MNKVEDSARYQPAGQRQTTIFIANFGHSVLSGVAQLPQAVTHPGRTLNGMAFSAAGAVDNMLNTNMNMTATQWANAQYRSARSMSSDDLARLSGKATALALPVAGGLYAKGVGGATSFTGTINTGAEVAIAQRVPLIAKQMAEGHAFEKHVLGVNNSAGAEFSGLGIRTRAQLAAHIEKVITNPTTSGSLRNGRSYFFDKTTDTIVIRNPKAPDGGTTFRINRDAFPDPMIYIKILK